MRVLIAPDKFKGTLTAREAAAAIRAGIERAARELAIAVDFDECPVADGGEGTLEALAAALPRARRQTLSVRTLHGQHEVTLLLSDSEILDVEMVSIRLGRVAFLTAALAAGTLIGSFAFTNNAPLQTSVLGAAAALLVIGAVCVVGAWTRIIARRRRNAGRNSITGFIESASVIGLASIPASMRDPELLGTEPVGGLILQAIHAGARTIVVGLGGSATVDGGIGAAAALGWVFRDRAGSVIGDPEPTCGRSLGLIASVRAPHTPPPRVIALCDVSNPLLGPAGAARVYGPQKGATPEQIERLEDGLENLVRVCRECGIDCDPVAPGAGAAGGLGFGLATFLGADLVQGSSFVLDASNFDARVAAADLVITGEGRMDMQTARGKACAEVARRAARAGKPCIAVVGRTEGEPGPMREALALEGLRFELIERSVGTEGFASAEHLVEAAARAFALHLRRSDKAPPVNPSG